MSLPIRFHFSLSSLDVSLVSLIINFAYTARQRLSESPICLLFTYSKSLHIGVWIRRKLEIEITCFCVLLPVLPVYFGTISKFDFMNNRAINFVSLVLSAFNSQSKWNCMCSVGHEWVWNLLSVKFRVVYGRRRRMNKKRWIRKWYIQNTVRKPMTE